LDIPYNLDEANITSLNDEKLARRYNVAIKASDLKKVVGGGNFSDRVMTFFINFLDEKKVIMEKVLNTYAFDEETTSSFAIQNPLSQKFAFEKSLKLIDTRLRMKNGFKTLKRAFFIAKYSSNRYYLIEYVRDYKRNDEKWNKKSKGKPTIFKFVDIQQKKKYGLILYDPNSESDPKQQERLLEVWREFIIFVFKEAGEKADVDDFETVIGSCLKQPNLLDLSSTVCQYLVILFEENSPTNDSKLMDFGQKELSHLRMRIKTLIETIGTKDEIPEYIFKRY
jgi:hypothetical protein